MSDDVTVTMSGGSADLLADQLKSNPAQSWTTWALLAPDCENIL